MKISFIKNDTTTYKDEIVLSLITLFALVIGVLLVIFRPSFWIISESRSGVLGVLLVLLALMYVPCIIYRLVENNYSFPVKYSSIRCPTAVLSV